MRDTLVKVHQQRMDRCQSEQFWIVALVTALNGFLYSQRESVLRHVDRDVCLVSLVALSVVAFLFVLHRMAGYYEYRNVIADLLTVDAASRDADAMPSAVDYMREKRTMFCFHGAIWIVVFALAIFAPPMCQILVLKIDTSLASPHQSCDATSLSPDVDQVDQSMGEKKAAEPGATDNPDDAQRLREDQ